jgi:hypothetical protein
MIYVTHAALEEIVPVRFAAAKRPRVCKPD